MLPYLPIMLPPSRALYATDEAYRAAVDQNREALKEAEEAYKTGLAVVLVAFGAALLFALGAVLWLAYRDAGVIGLSIVAVGVTAFSVAVAAVRRFL